MMFRVSLCKKDSYSEMFVSLETFEDAVSFINLIMNSKSSDKYYIKIEKAEDENNE